MRQYASSYVHMRHYALPCVPIRQMRHHTRVTIRYTLKKRACVTMRYHASPCVIMRYMEFNLQNYETHGCSNDMIAPSTSLLDHPAYSMSQNVNNLNTWILEYWVCRCQVDACYVLISKYEAVCFMEYGGLYVIQLETDRYFLLKYNLIFGIWTLLRLVLLL